LYKSEINEVALQSKITVYVAVAGVFALMGGIVYYASLDNVELEQVEVELSSVKLKDVNTVDNQAKFDVTFLVKNPSDKTLTVSQIDYQLFGDGELIGSGLYSTADVSLPGRAIFYSGAEIPLKNIFVLSKSETDSGIYEDAINGKISSFSAEGKITTQTAWSEIDVDFNTGN
jgi:LEA14-like dessication related protein